jgi:hypothetical protein
MKPADSTKLRNLPEKKGVVIRKKDPKDPLELEFEEFLKRWRDGLKRRSYIWQGPRAVAELQRKKMFAFLLCKKRSDTDWQADDLLRRIVSEMRAYRTDTTSRLMKEYFDDADEFLRGVINKMQKAEDGTKIGSLQFVLQDLKKKAGRARETVARLRKNKKNWQFGMWQHGWPEVPRRNLVSRKKELDTRLQAELGKMLADYLRPAGISLETIARLVLLAYWAGGLFEPKDGKSPKTDAGGILTVRNIRENLRDAKLHKAKSFRRRRKRK